MSAHNNHSLFTWIGYGSSIRSWQGALALLVSIVAVSAASAQHPGVNNIVWQSSSNGGTTQAPQPYNPLKIYDGVIRYFVPDNAQVTVTTNGATTQLDFRQLVELAVNGWNVQLAAQQVPVRIQAGSHTVHNADIRPMARTRIAGELMFDSESLVAVTIAPETPALSDINMRLNHRHITPILGGIYFGETQILTNIQWRKLTQYIKADLTHDEKLKIIYYTALLHELGHLLGHDHPIIPSARRDSITLDNNSYNATGSRFVYDIPLANQTSAPLMDRDIVSYFENRSNILGRNIESIDDVIPATVEVQAVNTVCLTGTSHISTLKRSVPDLCPEFTLEKIITSPSKAVIPATLYNILR